MAISSGSIFGSPPSSPFTTLSELGRRQRQTAAQLSSGNMLVSGAVDPAGLAVAEQLTTQVNGLAQAQRNAADARSLLQTADSALGSAQNMLQQERSLTVEAGNGALTQADLQTIQGQINQLSQGVNDVANQTQFNTLPLLNGQQAGPGGLTFQVGANSGQTIRGTIDGANTQQLGVASLDVTTQAGQAQGLSQTDQAVNTVSSQRAGMGSLQNRLTDSGNNAATSQENALAARARITDTNVAQASSRYLSSLLRQQFSLWGLKQQSSAFGAQGMLLGA
ncbi:MAG: flagellin N-terminal helical domain-containing protein [Chloroflexota bacterium]